MLHVLLHAAIALAVVWVPVSAVARAFGDPPLTNDGVEAIGLARWPVLLVNTLIVTGTATLIAVGVGLPVGVLAARTNLPGRGVVRGLAGFLACLPPIVYAGLAIAVVPLWRMPPSAVLCGIGYGLVFLPLAVIVCDGLARRVPAALEDAALLDASAARVLCRVTMRQCLPGAAALALLVITLVATDMALTDLMRVRTFAEEVYTQYALRRSGVGPLLTGAPLLGALAAMLAVCLTRGVRLASDRSVTHEPEPRRMRLLGAARRTAVVLLLVAAAALAWPAYRLLMQIESLSLAWRSAESLIGEIGRSLAVGAPAAMLMAAAAVGLAHGMVRNRAMGVVGVTAIALLLALPAPSAGIALVDLLNHPGWRGAIYDSPLVLIAGYLVRFLPVAVLLLVAAIQSIPREFEQMARTDGADWAAVQRYVIWPLVAREAAIAALICLVLAFAEIGTSVLIAPPGYSIASVRVFGLLHGGVYRDVAVLTILSAICMVGPWAGLAWLLRRRTRSN